MRSTAPLRQRTSPTGPCERNLLRNLGRAAEAAEAYDRAIGLAVEPATRQFLLARRG